MGEKVSGNRYIHIKLCSPGKIQTGILKKKISRFPRAEVLCYNRERYPAIVAEFYAIVTMDQRRCSEAENGRIARPLTITDTSSPFRCRLCLIWWRQNAIKHWSIDVKWCLCVAPNTHVSANEVIKNSGHTESALILQVRKMQQTGVPSHKQTCISH